MNALAWTSVITQQAIRAGRTPNTYARRAEAREAVAAAGGRPVADLADLAGADVVVVALYDAEQVEEVVVRVLLPHLAPGATVVSHVTTSRSETEGFAAAAAAAGVQWVDAPIDGAAEDIAEGRLVVLLGGPPAALDRVEPVLAAYGSPLLRLGDVGQATAFKLVNNALLAANTQLAVAGTRLARDQGIAEDVALEAFAGCTGGSAALRVIQLAGGIADFERLAAPYLHKDVAAFRASGRKLGVIDKVITDGPLNLA